MTTATPPARTSRAKNLITGTIKGVAENRTPTVYFLSGHGEKSLDSYTRFTTNLTNYNYAAKELNLSEADAVPEDCSPGCWSQHPPRILPTQNPKN